MQAPTGAYRNPPPHLQPPLLHQFEAWNALNITTTPTQQQPQLSMYNFNALQLNQLNAHLNPTLQSNAMFINQTTASQFNSLMSNALPFDNLSRAASIGQLAQHPPNQPSLSELLVIFLKL
jgi:hypothetical protein